MTDLDITVTGTDSDGNTASAQVTVSVLDAATVPPVEPPGFPVQPPVAVPPADGTAGPPWYREPPPQAPQEGPPPGPQLTAMAQQADAPQLLGQPVQIPGLGNATGHQTTETASKAKPVTAPQATTSQILFRRTGGFR
jgi:hypothetical protein